MANLELRPAKRGAIPLRVGLYGEAGQGKTYSAISVGVHLCLMLGLDPATALGVIDTEIVCEDSAENGHGSAEKYQGRFCGCEQCVRRGPTFEFQTLLVPPTGRSVETHLQAIRVCATSGIEVLVYDSISHEWADLLNLVDQVKANSSDRRDPWGAADPMHKRFVSALLNYPGHVIACMRAKTKFDRNVPKGKSFINLGVLPIQKDTISYEFDVMAFMNSGTMTITKTRDDDLENKVFDHPGERFAKHLLEWSKDERSVLAARKADERAKVLAEHGAPGRQSQQGSKKRYAGSDEPRPQEPPREERQRREEAAAPARKKEEQKKAKESPLVEEARDLIARVGALGAEGVEIAGQATGFLRDKGGSVPHLNALIKKLRLRINEIGQKLTEDQLAMDAVDAGIFGSGQDQSGHAEEGERPDQPQTDQSPRGDADGFELPY